MAPTATPDRVLDAAEALFFSDGIAITGVDAVAERAGVAIATLYKHFGSKDGLLAALLRRRLQSWVEHWDAAVAAARTPEDRLLALFDAVTTYRAAAGDTQWCCFLATASERPRTRDDHDPVLELVDHDTRLVRERLRTLATETTAPDPVDLADSLLVVYTGALASLLRGAPDDPLTLARRMARSLVEAATRH